MDRTLTRRIAAQEPAYNYRVQTRAMTDDLTRIAFVAAVPPTVASLCGLLQSVWNGRKVNALRTTADDLRTRSEEIHILVNSQLTAVKASLIQAEQKIIDLQDLTVRLSEELAQRNVIAKPRRTRKPS